MTGGGDVGAALADHPGIDKVAFTGSTEVGRQIQASLAGTGREDHPSPGGKAANLVSTTAPVDQAVEGIVNAILLQTGHVCCAGSRLLVQESVADEVVGKLQARIATLRFGDPMDKNTDEALTRPASWPPSPVADLDVGLDGRVPRRPHLAVPAAAPRFTSRPRFSP